MKLLDNVGPAKLGDALGNAIDRDAKMSVIASYFTIFAYGRMREELQDVEELNFIFSEPTFVKRMADAKEPKEFALLQHERERGVGGVDLELTLRNNLSQRALAHECAQWLRSHARFKSVKTANQLQTGSTYVIENGDSSMQAFMGPNNPFTLEGLGYERRPDVISAISHLETTAEAQPYRNMFSQFWQNPDLLEDVTSQVIEQVETLYRENAPEFVYFLTLFHIFRDFIDEEESDPIKPGLNFQDTVVWNRLYDFQKDGVVGAIRKLEKYKGCIIADSVGLGKTFEALAIIKYYELRNDRVLVLAPKRLRDNWTMYRGNDTRNILADDRFNYDVLNHTDLSQHRGMSGDINLETLNWANYDLVVIDESHNFRNRPTDTTTESRYDRLLNDIVKSGVRTKVLMLSATPVNNRLLDLRNQLDIITEDDDAYLAQSDGIPSINYVTKTAQQRFKEWSELPDVERTTQSFVESLNSDYFKLLDIFTIARGRKHIAKYYASNGDNQFPERLKPISKHPSIDTEGQLPPIADLNDLIAQLRFSQFQLLGYVMPDRQAKYVEQYGDSWGTNFQAQKNRTQAIAGLMRVNLLKRLESSISSFRLSLERILAGARTLDEQLDKVQRGPLAPFSDAELASSFDEDDDAEEFQAAGKVNVDLRDIDAVKVRDELGGDIDILERLLGYASEVTPERDKKLAELCDFMQEKIEHTPYNDGNRKILVFSAFADTARYLYDTLSGLLKADFGVESALVTGAGGAQSTLKMKRTTFEEVLARFSPHSKELPDDKRSQGEIDVVFATDCISEGQNLQDCDCLINYDIHWNPVRIIQRFGRIDRLGSINKRIQLVDFWPDMDLDEYIQLEGRVRNRMVLLDSSATGDENVLEGKRNDEMNDLQYRKRQLQQLQHEVLDLEDIAGNISITDFALDDFRVELKRYVESHPGELDEAPMGMHAVAPIPDALRDELEPGVIFCLRQNDESKGSRESNPTFPYCVVYVSDKGNVKTTHAHPKMALDYMRAVCAGQTEPIRELCDRFNRVTHDGEDMSHYSKLLDAVVKSINGTEEKGGIDSLFDLGAPLTTGVAGFDDYSLVSFVVLR
ncbi:helicase-related protein [Bifidobacterium choloepi]|uniref:Helicase n=1 Tax=Bifidobacterium choloepi TaxID=2614131 RepID=A0A6I5NDY2_9BIFI|nr:helicase-related protein [Bifidobacterium choloepi]NEG69594.1 helicase [Bifidobacterium choloepi]